MSMTIPTIPNLPAGYTVQLADMQNLAYAATFLLTKPIVRIVDTVGGKTINTGFTTVQFSSATVNTDGMWNPSQQQRLTVQTPGWYRVTYGVNVGTTGGTYTSAVGLTTGPNNPAGSGVVSSKFWGSGTDPSSGQFTWLRASGIWPFYIYSGDFLNVNVQAAATGSTTGITGPTGAGTAPPGSYFGLELVSI